MVFSIKPLEWVNDSPGRFQCNTSVGFFDVWEYRGVFHWQWQYCCVREGGKCHSIDECKTAAEACYRDILTVCIVSVEGEA